MRIRASCVSGSRTDPALPSVSAPVAVLDLAREMMGAVDKPNCIIVDVDGTIVDVSGVRHYVRDDRRHKDFDHFHLGAMFCPPIRSTLDTIAAAHDDGLVVVIVTARKERWRHHTRWYLEKHGIRAEHLVMRADDDDRRDVEVKREILSQIRQWYEPVLAVDDNPSVVDMWRAEGIPVQIVPGWP